MSAFDPSRTSARRCNAAVVYEWIIWRPFAPLPATGRACTLLESRMEDPSMKLPIGLAAAALLATGFVTATPEPASAVIYCTYVGYPAGCIARAGVVLRPRPVASGCRVDTRNTDESRRSGQPRRQALRSLVRGRPERPAGLRTAAGCAPIRNEPAVLRAQPSLGHWSVADFHARS